MSESQPTRPITVIDVPEIDNIESKFVYNRWTSDETVSDASISGVGALKSPTAISESSLNTVGAVLPRYMIIRWSPVATTPLPSGVTAVNISTNLDKIVYEDEYAPDGFTSIKFQDGQIVDSLHQFVASSMRISGLASIDSNLTSKQNSYIYNDITDNTVTKQFIDSVYNNPEKNCGVRWDSKVSGYQRVRTGLEEVDSASISVRVNNTLLKDVLDAALLDPDFSHTDNIKDLHSASSGIKSAAGSTAASSPSQYKTVIKPASVTYGYASSAPSSNSQSIIGYLLEKVEIRRDGSTIKHEPIVVQGATSTIVVDPKVRYGSKYAYYVRTIAQVRAQVIDVDTSDLCLADVLVGSVPSRAAVSWAVEDIAPPPPNNPGFIWDYATGRLHFHWSFPVNSQRDIVKFQIFRRETLDEAYELLRVLDFDTTVQPYYSDALENLVDESTVQKCSSPRCEYVDEEFTTSSDYIYTVCSVDAHGHSSNYGIQYRVRWDRFKNSLNVSLVSHSGAPKSYPNMYLQADAFVDTMKPQGFKKCSIYMTPEHLSVRDRHGVIGPALATDLTGGSYRLSVINLDNLESLDVDIAVQDKRTPPPPSTII